MLGIHWIDIIFEVIGMLFCLYQLAHWYFHGKFKRKYVKQSKKRRIEMTRLK